MRERDLHVAVVGFLKWALPAEAMFCHVPNEGKRGWKAQADFKALGAVAGFPDLVILWSGKAFCVELKAPKQYLSPAQKVAHERLTAACIPVRVCRSTTEVALVLKDWGFPLTARIAA